MKALARAGHKLEAVSQREERSHKGIVGGITDLCAGEAPRLCQLLDSLARRVLDREAVEARFLDGPDVALAGDITRHLNAMDIPAESNSVTLWLGELPSTQDFGRLGCGASREDVIMMLADREIPDERYEEVMTYLRAELHCATSGEAPQQAG